MAVMRAKFKLDSIERSLYGQEESRTIKMSPVYGGGERASEENKRFWKYSPNGELRLCTVNVAAVDHLKLGAEYFLDITEAI